MFALLTLMICLCCRDVESHGYAAKPRRTDVEITTKWKSFLRSADDQSKKKINKTMHTQRHTARRKKWAIFKVTVCDSHSNLKFKKNDGWKLPKTMHDRNEK